MDEDEKLEDAEVAGEGGRHDEDGVTGSSLHTSTSWVVGDDEEVGLGWTSTGLSRTGLGLGSDQQDSTVLVGV